MVNIKYLDFDRKPGTARLSNRMNHVLLTINECIKGRKLFPALILIYSSIDILGSLKNQNGYATPLSFKYWVSNYLFKAKAFPFSEKDLYGARCGIVHTMRYDSKDGAGLKKIVYGFYGHNDDIRKISDPTKKVGVYVEDLFGAFVEAYSKYLEDLEDSKERIINENLDKLPEYIDLIQLD